MTNSIIITQSSFQKQYSTQTKQIFFQKEQVPLKKDTLPMLLRTNVYISPNKIKGIFKLRKTIYLTPYNKNVFKNDNKYCLN